MKPFVTSSVLHTLILTWGLVSFGQPRTLDMTQGEALPVSIVPIEEYSQSMVGERDEEMTEAPAPQPTETPETLPMPAENIGDNEVDLASPPRPVTAPRERVQTATSEAPPPPPPPAPEPEPEPVVEPEPEPAPEPEPEVAEPAPEPEPVIDEAAPQVAESEPEPEPQVQNVPRPQARPTPPVRAAETPVRETPQPERPAETPREEPRQVTESRAEREPEFDADEIAALLNREQSAGGGAQRSDAQASLGGTRNTGQRLSQTELDALRGQIARCWSPPAGVMDAGSLRVSIQMSLDPSGALQGMPQVVAGGGGGSAERAAGEAAVRAVRRCAPYNLPADKYETWSQVQINFDPSEMF